MDGLYLGSQLTKDQLLPLQPSSSSSAATAAVSSTTSLSLVQHQHQQQLLQTRTGSQSLLRTSRSPSATRSNEQNS